MDGILTFHKIRDTRCSRDNKIQIGLFQRATQSRFCSWVTWQIICQCSFCVLLRLASVQCSNYFKLSGPQQAEFGKGLASAKIARYSFSVELATLLKVHLRWVGLGGWKSFSYHFREGIEMTMMISILNALNFKLLFDHGAKILLASWQPAVQYMQ